MTVDKNTLNDRILGCLAGGAAGDALGYAVEFNSLNAIKKKYGSSGITEYDHDHASGLAQISDDTQMTLFTAAGLLAHETAAASGRNVKSRINYVHDAYSDWYLTQDGMPGKKLVKDGPECWLLEIPELHSRRAPGITCMNALSTSKTRSLYKPINNSKGCGGIMRVAPAGLLYPDESEEETVELAAELSAITHGHPLGCFPSGIFASIIHQAVYAGDGRSLRSMADKALAAARNLYGKSDLWQELEELTEKAMDFARNGRDDEENIRELGEGWVAEETLAVSLYCALRHEDDFSSGIIAAVNHDGDSDSTGAVAGNILGAIHGYEAIDAKWKDKLELKHVILEMAEDVFRGTDMEGNRLLQNEDWRRKYI